VTLVVIMDSLQRNSYTIRGWMAWNVLFHRSKRLNPQDSFKAGIGGRYTVWVSTADTLVGRPYHVSHGGDKLSRSLTKKPFPLLPGAEIKTR
jgi:hypothetical protein